MKNKEAEYLQDFLELVESGANFDVLTLRASTAKYIVSLLNEKETPVERHKELVSDDELRAQGVEIMKAKTLQSMQRMQRTRDIFDTETWKIAEQCLLGMVDGCDVVAKELRNGTLPCRFRDITNKEKRIELPAGRRVNCEPERYLMVSEVASLFRSAGYAVTIMDPDNE